MISRFYKQILLFVAILCCDNISFAQTIVSLKSDLENATSLRIKADVCFDISKKYADALKIDSALYFAEKIKELSQATNYEAGLGKYHLALSIVQYYRRLTNESKKNASEAIKIFDSQKDYSFLGLAYWQLAVNEGISGNIDPSRKNYWLSVHFLIAAADNSNLYRTYFWLARSYNSTSDYDSAAHYLIKSLQLAEDSKDAFKIYNAALDLGKTFLNLHDLKKAYQYLNYGLKHRTATTNKVGIWTNTSYYATCLSLLHEFARADSVIKEFETGAKEFNHAWGWIILDKLKGVQEFEKQNYPGALKYLKNAYDKLYQIETNKSDINDIVFRLGSAEFKMQQYDSAIAHLRHASQLSLSIKSLLEAFEADYLLAESFEKINIPDSALLYFRRYSLLKDSVLSLEKQKLFAEVTSLYESEKKEQSIRILQKENEANALQLQLQNQQIDKQQLEDDKKSQQLSLVSQQNEINKLDASQKTLSLDNEKKENEKNQAKLKLLEQETAYQKLLASKQNQQKNIVLISIAIILALSGFAIYRYIRRKKLQNQQQVLNERLRISRELHDEVGSTLSGIAMYGHLTKEQIKASKTEEVERSLNNILQSAGEMMNKLSDIVWLVNPEKDSFQKLIERLEEFAINIARTKNIDMRINLPDKLDGLNIPVETRRDIYLFCKEAINNAVKYSDAKMIELTMRETENKKIEILVADNGLGFNAATVKKGNGLLNMKQRAEQVNGVYSLESSPGHGTNISLSFKIT